MNGASLYAEEADMLMEKCSLEFCLPSETFVFGTKISFYLGCALACGISLQRSHATKCPSDIKSILDEEMDKFFSLPL
jgi:hypothetical protein